MRKKYIFKYFSWKNLGSIKNIEISMLFRLIGLVFN
jgi:hypothetical protein